METKNITIRIPVDMYEGMQKKANDPRQDAGSISQQIVDGLRKLETITRLSTNELRGKFTVEEWCCLADMLNGTRVDGGFRYNADALVAEIEDAELYDGTCGKWGVGKDALAAKCKELTAAQLDALYTRVGTFWLHPDTDILKWGEF